MAVLETQEDLEQELNTFFKELLEELGVDRGRFIENVMRFIPRKITDTHNEMLLRPIDKQELDEVMKQMEKGKAPGPDGFTRNFFHEFWDIIKEEV